MKNIQTHTLKLSENYFMHMNPFLVTAYENLNTLQRNRKKPIQLFQESLHKVKILNFQTTSKNLNKLQKKEKAVKIISRVPHTPPRATLHS